MIDWLLGFVLGNLLAYVWNIPHFAVISAALIGVVSSLIVPSKSVFWIALAWGNLSNAPWFNSHPGTYAVEDFTYWKLPSEVGRVRVGQSTFLLQINDARCKSVRVYFFDTVTGPFEGDSRGICEQLSGSLSIDILKMLEAVATPWFSWLYLGRRNLDLSDPREAFRSLGVVHLLVISGLHLSLIFKILVMTLQLILNLVLSFLPAVAPLLIPARFGIRLLGLGSLAIYVWIIGGGFAATRAFSTAASGVALSISGGSGDRSFSRIWMGMCIQSVVSPTGFVHPVNLLCWLSYLVVFRYPIAGFRQFLGVNVLFTLISVAFFSEFSVLGLLANLAISPIFLAIFVILGVSQLIPNLAPFVDLAFDQILSTFVRFLNDYGHSKFLLSVTVPDLLRVFILVIVAALSLRPFKPLRYQDKGAR